MMVWLFVLFTLVGFGFGESSLPSRRRLDGDYSVLNSILGQLELEVDTSSIDPVVSQQTLFTVTATLGNAALCRNLGVGNVTVTSGLFGAEIVNGTVYERYDLNVTVDRVTIVCDLPVCIDTNLPFDEEDCGGTITVISDANSNSQVKLGQKLLAENFTTGLPAIAQDAETDCGEIVNVDNIYFTGKNMGKIYGIDITNLIVNSLNGANKADSVEPIRDALCEQVQNFTVTLNELLVMNPFNATIGTETREEVVQDALLAQDSLVLGSDVKLANLRDNFFVDLLFPDRVNDTIVITESTFQVGCPENTTNTSQTIYGLVDSFLNTTLEANNGTLDQFDVLSLLPNVDVSFLVDPIGSIHLEMEELLLSVVPVDPLAPPPPGEIPIEMIGPQSAILPTLSLGQIEIEAKVRLEADISTISLIQGQLTSFTLNETFTMNFKLEDLVADIALLIPINLAKLPTLEIGSLSNYLFDCVLSLFAPEGFKVSGARLFASSIDLALDGFQDGVLNFVADVLDALLPIYESATGDLVNVLASILGDVNLSSEVCPSVTANPENLATPYNFSRGLFAIVSDLISLESVNCLITDNIGMENKIMLINETLDIFTVQLPSLDSNNGNTISLSVEEVSVNGLVPPPMLDQLAVLSTPQENPFYPQGLVTVVSLEPTQNLIALNFLVNFDVLGSQTNKLNISVSLSSLELLIDVYASMSVFAVESKQFQDLVNLDCWVADLSPYGGLQNLTLDLSSLVLTANCVACENPIVASLANQLTTSWADALDAIKDVRDDFIQTQMSKFQPGNWEATISKAKAACAASKSGVQMPLPEKEQDLTSGIVFVSIFFSALGFLGVATFSCGVGGGAKKTDGSIVPGKNDEKASEEDNELFLLANRALYQQAELIPKPVRIMIPVLIVLNLVLFLIGHLDIVLYTDIVGQIASIEFGLDDFSKLSVITTTEKLLNGGAIFLALMLIVFSVVWPYVKLIGLILTFFLSTKRLSFQKRGKIITLFDQLGKWSLVELYFLLFFFIVMAISIESPNGLPFIPDDLYDFSLVIEPQYNLYTFTTALMLSLWMSNLVVIYHERVENRILEIQRKREGKHETDLVPLSVRDFLLEREDKNGNKFKVGVTSLGAVILCLMVLGSIGLILFASTVPVLELRIVGLVRTLMEIGGQETVQQISLFSFIADAFQDVSIGEIYFALVFVVTVLVIPILQLLMLVVIPFKKFTLPKAITFLEWNQVLSAWSCTEVFVFAIAVTILEIGTVTEFLIEGECDGVPALMNSVLLPLNLVTEEDIGNSCLGISASVELGSYLFFIALLISNMAHLFIVKVFQEYIDARKSSTSPNLDLVVATPVKEEWNSSTKIGLANSILAKLGIVKVEKEQQQV